MYNSVLNDEDKTITIFSKLLLIHICVPIAGYACSAYLFSVSDDERKKKLEDQAKNNAYHRFVESNLVLKQGLIDKRKVSGG